MKTPQFEFTPQTEEEKNEIIKKYAAIGTIGNRDILKAIPLQERRYKCHTCHNIVDTNPCPNCNETSLEILCPLDHCYCTHTDAMGTVKLCPLCGEVICPECGTHDVVVVSRVTGYLSDVSGWNRGKRAEFEDRVRYNNLSI
jgi:hypothetical protein